MVYLNLTDKQARRDLRLTLVNPHTIYLQGVWIRLSGGSSHESAGYKWGSKGLPLGRGSGRDSPDGLQPADG